MAVATTSESSVAETDREVTMVPGDPKDILLVCLRASLVMPDLHQCVSVFALCARVCVCERAQACVSSRVCSFVYGRGGVFAS